MDGSLVDANASNNAVLKGCPDLIAQLREQLQGEMAKLDEPKDDRARIYYERKNKGLLNTTDPDAAIVRKGSLSPRARYITHRAVDDAHGIITATETTPGDVEENAKLMDLVDQHERHTSTAVETVVADKQYGTADNFRACHERGIISHMGDMLAPQLKKGRREEIFGYEDFSYNPSTDTFTCPAGQTLTRRKHKKTRKAYEYACPGAVCKVCCMRLQCTRAQGGLARTVKRHYNQEAVDAARAQSHSPAGRKDRRRRKWFTEGSFADAANNQPRVQTVAVAQVMAATNPGLSDCGSTKRPHPDSGMRSEAKCGRDGHFRDTFPNFGPIFSLYNRWIPISMTY